MGHPAGERLRCNVCGAEIIYVKGCPCPETEQKAHSDVCCDEEMESLGVESLSEKEWPIQPEHRH